MGTTPNLAAVAEILKRHLPSEQYRGLLFGSRATGAARGYSDWDIGILGPSRLPAAIMQAIREDLDELPTLHTFDVVDLATVPDEFRREVLRSTVPLA